MDGYMTILKETLSGPELKNSYVLILGFFAEAQEQLAAGNDYDAVMEALNASIGEYFGSVFADPPG